MGGLAHGASRLVVGVATADAMTGENVTSNFGGFSLLGPIGPRKGLPQASYLSAVCHDFVERANVCSEPCIISSKYSVILSRISQMRYTCRHSGHSGPDRVQRGIAA
jgi:hypothetical protein